MVVHWAADDLHMPIVSRSVFADISSLEYFPICRKSQPIHNVSLLSDTHNSNNTTRIFKN